MPVAGGVDGRNARIGIEPRVPMQARARERIGESSMGACKASLRGAETQLRGRQEYSNNQHPRSGGWWKQACRQSAAAILMKESQGPGRTRWNCRAR